MKLTKYWTCAFVFYLIVHIDTNLAFVEFIKHSETNYHFIHAHSAIEIVKLLSIYFRH